MVGKKPNSGHIMYFDTNLRDKIILVSTFLTFTKTWGIVRIGDLTTADNYVFIESMYLGTYHRYQYWTGLGKRLPTYITVR